MFYLLQDFTEYCKGWSYILATVVLVGWVAFAVYLNRERH